MGAFKLGEELPGWPDSPVSSVLQTLADALFGVGAPGNIQQALIGFRILHDGRCLPVHREHDGALAPLKLLHEVA